MSSDVVGPPSVMRIATVAALVTVTLNTLTGGFKIIGNQPNGAKSGGSGSVLQTYSNSGAQVGQLNASGSLVLSGGLVINHGKTGSGRFIVKGTDGGGGCYDDQDGTGCTCEDFNNGVAVLRIGTTAECAAESYR